MSDTSKNKPANSPSVPNPEADSPDELSVEELEAAAGGTEEELVGPNATCPTANLYKCT